MRTSRLAVAGATAALLILNAAPSLAAPAPSSAAQQQLGKHLFFDTDLSAHGNQSCASCHAPSVGWTGGEQKINEGGGVYEGSIAGRFGDRKPPAAAYAQQAPVFSVDEHGAITGGNFWDGRATGEKLGNPAADQAQGPFLNPVEQALPDGACVVYLACESDYAGLVGAAAGQDVCKTPWPKDAAASCAAGGQGIAKRLPAGQQRKVQDAYDAFGRAIAAYEGSKDVSPFDSKYDAYLAGRAQLSPAERRGLKLFEGKAQCSQCHTSTGAKPLFTDYTYDNLGVPKNPENPVYDTKPGFVDQGLGGFLKTQPEYDQLAGENLGKVKVPTLRNVAKGSDEVTKAYMHNGYFKTLEGVVHFYNTRDVLPACPGAYTEAEALAAKCWPKPEVKQNVNRNELGDLDLTAGEERDLVAFMQTLSDRHTASAPAAGSTPAKPSKPTKPSTPAKPGRGVEAHTGVEDDPMLASLGLAAVAVVGGLALARRR